jgi:hypothetical protein
MGGFALATPMPGRLGSVLPGFFVWGREGKWSEGETRNNASIGFTILCTSLLILLKGTVGYIVKAGLKLRCLGTAVTYGLAGYACRHLSA